MDQVISLPHIFLTFAKRHYSIYSTVVRGLKYYAMKTFR